MIKYFVLLFFLCSCTMQTPSSGQKTGIIVRLSECGFFNKTYEGDLIRGGLNDGSGAIGQSFHFTIEKNKNSLYHIAKECFEKQELVIIDYEKEAFTGIWRSESYSPAFVKSITKINK